MHIPNLLVPRAVAAGTTALLATAMCWATALADEQLVPSAHAPAGVMFDHMHKSGELMLGYRYMHSLQDGPMLTGTRIASDPELAAAGFSSTPAKMQMHMHMLDIMYAPNDWLTLMVMPQFVSMTMDMREIMGAEDDDHGHGGGAHGAHSHGTRGIGDTSLVALVRLHESEMHHLHIGIGFSAPTGSVDEKGSEGRFTHYMMQLGSGTWDFLPGLTYLGRSGDWSWGAQLSAIERLEDKNESGFRFGHQIQTTAWTAFELTDWLSASTRLAYYEQGSLDGHYNGPHNHSSPPDLQANYGGRFWDAALGLNAVVRSGALAGNRLGIEWVEPVSDDVNGFQQERTGTVHFSWSRKF